MSKEFEEVLEEMHPAVVAINDYWNRKQAVPRVGCQACQFEYAPTERHECRDDLE